MARPRRFERPTFAFGGQRSIQLSYGRLCALNRPKLSIRQRTMRPAEKRFTNTANAAKCELSVRKPAAMRQIACVN